jgi:hypothetical protein
MHEWCSIYVLDGKQTPLVMLSVVWCSYAFMIYGSWAPYMLSLHAYVVFDILFSFSLHHLLIYTVGRATCAGRSSSLMKCTRCASSCRAFAYGWSMQSEPICTSRSLGGGRRMDERSRTSSKVPNAVAATVTRRLHLMRRTGRGRSTTGRFPWSHESKSDLHPDGPEPPLQPRVCGEDHHFRPSATHTHNCEASGRLEQQQDDATVFTSTPRAYKKITN